MKYKLILMLAIILVLPLINASLGTYKLNDCVQIITVLNSSYVNISILTSPTPNPSIILTNIAMTKIGNSFNYTFCGTNKTGIYNYGYCDDQLNCYGNSFEITPTGTILSIVQIYIYLFFLLLCLVLTFFSIRLFKKNKYSKDVIKNSELYQMKKRNEFLYYMTVLKKHMWIVGIFGIYLSLLIFTALLNQLVYNLGLSDLDNILGYVVLGFSWGLIPFTIFWFIWLIFVFYKSTTEIMRYQFGNIGRER